MLAAGQQQGIVRGRSPLTELTSARRALCQLVLYSKKIEYAFWKAYSSSAFGDNGPKPSRGGGARSDLGREGVRDQV